jgi:hypothetical protein
VARQRASADGRTPLYQPERVDAPLLVANAGIKTGN